MGGDGGVIAAKREYMQSCGDVFGMKGGMAKTALNRTETAELRTKVCAISNEVLREPVAACELGYLYNKDVLISGLLNRDLNPAFNHIRGLKDIVECKLTPNPSFEKEDRAFDGPEPARFMCPVTLQEMNGSHAFVVLMSTGWVMSEKATKEVGIAGLQEEYGPFTEDDIVGLAPTDEERETRTRQLITKREKARLAKKSSKKSARREKTAASAKAGATKSSSSPPSAGAGVIGEQPSKPSASTGDEAQEDAAGGESKKGKKRRRALEKEAASAAAVAANGASAGPNSARLAGAAAEAVKKNKEASKVYASLFGKKDVSNEHLFIATAGHRYNLG
ncbi:conserved unknown protein [Ectocarpus siliculosus]|uniref:Replication termination factor 2 n=1 Tax=Ectocarpus siliculosus TaxID=2880 RepID=D7FJ42_ECTSI|nr:conserved unknown protein [Ectocarpus siliculosus]|eukprot:CBJ28952.1 conserved unknown protein [Ectocarpus siliculosus]